MSSVKFRSARRRAKVVVFRALCESSSITESTGRLRALAGAATAACPAPPPPIGGNPCRHCRRLASGTLPFGAPDGCLHWLGTQPTSRAKSGLRGITTRVAPDLGRLNGPSSRQPQSSPRPRRWPPMAINVGRTARVNGWSARQNTSGRTDAELTIVRTPARQEHDEETSW